MIGALLGGLFAVGVISTTDYFVARFPDEMSMASEVWCACLAMFWPAYWAWRALDGATQKLLPAPAEIVVLDGARHFDSPTKSCYEYGCADDCPVVRARHK